MNLIYHLNSLFHKVLVLGKVRVEGLWDFIGRGAYV